MLAKVLVLSPLRTGRAVRQGREVRWCATVGRKVYQKTELVSDAMLDRQPEQYFVTAVSWSWDEGRASSLAAAFIISCNGRSVAAGNRAKTALQ